MVLDSALLFSEAQAVKASAVSTDVLDLGPLYPGNDVRDIGVGTPVEFFVQVGKEAKTGGEGTTVKISLQTAKSSNFSEATEVLQSGELPVATLKSGYRYAAALPQGIQRYLRVNYTVDKGPLTGGEFTAGLVLSTDANHSYATATKITV